MARTRLPRIGVPQSRAQTSGADRGCLRDGLGLLARTGGIAGVLLAFSVAPGLADELPANLSDYLPAMPMTGGADINCTIKPLQMVDISSQVRGIVREVMVRPGETVQPGQPLVQLDTDMAAAEMDLALAKAEADATLQSALTNREGLARKEARLAKALAKKAVSLADHEAAQLELALAETAVRREEQALRIARMEYERSRLLVEKSLIRSPVAGMVGENLVDPGESVNEGPIATVYVTRPMRVEAFVPSQALGQFAPADGTSRSFAISIDGRAGPALPVTLDYVSQVADLTSNTVSVFFTLQADDVLPGSKCRLVSQPLAPGQTQN